MKKAISAVSIMGPTASGKSALAVELARLERFEIISVDSAQVYRGMDIGTAKPDPELLKEVPHHLINISDPSEPYSAADFRLDAIRLVEEISSRDKIPLLTGGTMLYFKALKEGLAALPPADKSVRRRISQQAQEYGWPMLHERLKQIDPIAAERIHVNDPQRLQRALEVFEISGKSMTEWQQQGSQSCPFEILEIAILPKDRLDLHRVIETRFHQMLTDGLIEEVQQLFDRDDLNQDLPAIKACGYRQVWAYLAGEIDYGTMVEKAIIATRQFAKRQFTWLRSWQGLKRIETPEGSKALKIIRASSILG